MVTTTTVYSFQKPDVSGDEDAWGGYLNANIDKYESILTGNTTITSLVITTADINGGTLDNVVIGGSTAAAVTGTTITGTSFVSSGNMTFGDNNKAIFGAGSDLQIYHDGTDSYISDQGTGRIKILGDNETYIANAANGEYKARFITDGAVELYYDAAKKFETTSTGIDVTGTVTADGLTVETSGDPSALIRNTSTGTVSLTLRRSANDDDYTDWTFDNTGGNLSIISDNTTRPNATRIKMTYDGDISFYEDTGTTAKFFWDASAESLGIGTTSPSAVLQAEHASNATIDAVTTGGATTRISSASTAGYLGTTTNHPALFITNGSERLRITSDGKIGIGTSSPSVALEVNGGTDNEPIKVVSTDAGSYVSVADNGTTGSTRLGAVGNDFKIDVNSSEAMRIDSSGNVGIGTSSPSSQLNIRGSSTTASLDIQGTDSTIQGRLYSDNSGQTILYADRLGNAASPALRFYTGTTERMRIDSSGNVGIGNTNPSDYNSNGNNLVVGTTSGNNGISIASATSGLGSIYFTDGTSGVAQYRGIVQYDHASDYMRFFTTSAERMRIDTSGNLLLGTTTTNPSGNNDASGVEISSAGQVNASRSGANALDINRGTSDGEIARFRKDGTTVGSIGCNGPQLFIMGRSTDSGIFFGTNNIYPFRTSGVSDDTIDIGHPSYRFDDIYATNGTIQTSDRNEKQDIAELTDAEQRVAVAAKGLLRKFRWKTAVAKKGDEARTHFGIIAQDLQAAFAAEGLDAGDYAMFISSTWTDEETGEERTRMGVRYSELLAFIIAAI